MNSKSMMTHRITYLKNISNRWKSVVGRWCTVIRLYAWGIIDIVSFGSGEMENAMAWSMSTKTILEKEPWIVWKRFLCVVPASDRLQWWNALITASMTNAQKPPPRCAILLFTLGAWQRGAVFLKRAPLRGWLFLSLNTTSMLWYTIAIHLLSLWRSCMKPIFRSINLKMMRP